MEMVRFLLMMWKLNHIKKTGYPIITKHFQIYKESPYVSMETLLKKVDLGVEGGSWGCYQRNIFCNSFISSNDYFNSGFRVLLLKKAKIS